MTGPYRIEIERKAVKRLTKMHPRERKQIVAAIDALATDPRPDGCTKLKARPGYRIRVGENRVIYDVDDQVVTVHVLRLGPRGEVYDA